MPERRNDRYFDTVSLSNFAQAGRLDLLIARYGLSARITPTVLDELLDGIAAGYGALRDIETALSAQKFSSADPLSATEREVYRELLRTLSPGEASCIVCAQYRGGMVVTDDKLARTRCTENGVEYTGAIGILKACCIDGMLAPRDADALLQTMVEAGYFSPVRNISGLL